MTRSLTMLRPFGLFRFCLWIIPGLFALAAAWGLQSQPHGNWLVQVSCSGMAYTSNSGAGAIGDNGATVNNLGMSVAYPSSRDLSTLSTGAGLSSTGLIWAKIESNMWMQNGNGARTGGLGFANAQLTMHFTWQPTNNDPVACPPLSFSPVLSSQPFRFTSGALPAPWGNVHCAYSAAICQEPGQGNQDIFGSGIYYIPLSGYGTGYC
jgi:hypothetical protein